MPGIFRGIKPRPHCQFLDHPRHVDTGQPARLYLAVPIDRPEERPGGDARLFLPRLNRADRTSLWVRAVPYPDLATPIQVPGYLAILHERDMEYRQIFTDGRPLPKDPQPSWNGYSTGKWVGDALVVETIGFREGLWADYDGSPLSGEAKITERFRRPNFGSLEIEMTVDDAKAYTKPWRAKIDLALQLDTDLLEYVCLEGERDSKHMVGK